MALSNDPLGIGTTSSTQVARLLVIDRLLTLISRHMEFWAWLSVMMMTIMKGRWEASAGDTAHLGAQKRTEIIIAGHGRQFRRAIAPFA